MLPIKRRVRKESFAKIMKEGVFVHSTSIYVRFLDRKDIFPSLFSFIVPNKVEKTSVGRHLIKRKLTAVVEKLLITLKPGFSVIVFVKKDLSTLPNNELQAEIVFLLRKIGVLH